MAKKNKSTYNILMYSHDTYGLGHIRRTMAIASQLAGPNVNILILTGSPLAGRFTFAENIDFVRIPGMIKKTNEEYQPLSIKIHPQHALNIRKNIIKATAKAFQPQLFIVDKEPLGLKKEVLSTLQWLRKNHPRARTVLGLRDIMDDAATVRADWTEKDVYGKLDELYSEIWVYGEKSFYDPAVEYAVPESVREKMFYTGYIPRPRPDREAVEKLRKRLSIPGNDRLVVVTTGGGGDGHAVMDHFLTMLENHSPSFCTVFVTGPFMPREKRLGIKRRAEKLRAKVYEFYQPMEEMLAAADLVVSMGGYNTVCEILSQKTVSLLIPREVPRKEQLIRARVLSENRLADYIPWNQVTPESLAEKTLSLLENSRPMREAMARFSLTGVSAMKERLAVFGRKGAEAA